jgi:hypothetical protein
MSNLNIPPGQWLAELFAYEYCGECGGDADDHDTIPFIGNWFAVCRHPISDGLSDDEIETELARRHLRQEMSLPMIETA